MKRTFNYTGRHGIARKHVSISVRPDGEYWTFDAILNLSEYKFAHNAEVWVEAHRQNLWMQWSWGTIAAPRIPASRKLLEFDVPDGVSFRVRVVQPPGNEHHKLLGEVDGIQPVKAGEAEDHRRPLIVPVPDELDQLLWKLDFDRERPTLLVNRAAKPSWRDLAVSPHFVGLVYPEVLRRILEKILLEEEWTDDEEADGSWQSDWMRFARGLGGLAALPIEHQTQERERWIDDAVAAFARRLQPRSLWDAESEKETSR